MNDINAMNADRLVTIPQTAAFFNKSVNTINRWIRDGLLPKPQIFGGSRYFMESVLANVVKTERRLDIKPVESNKPN